MKPRGFSAERRFQQKDVQILMLAGAKLRFSVIRSFARSNNIGLRKIVLCCAIGIFTASCNQTESNNFTTVESAGIERVSFDASKIVVSPYDGQSYILTTTNEFNDIRFMTRRDASGVSDRTFSHIRFAALRVYNHCQFARDAANAFNDSVNSRDTGWLAPDRHATKDIVLSRFYDRQEANTGVMGQEDITAYADSSYSHEDTLTEVAKCLDDMESVSFIDGASNKPSFIFWLRVDDDSSSDHLNDVYLTKVTYNGIMSIDLAGMIARNVASDLVLGAVGDVASSAVAASMR
jgi:hypothetical protein